VVHSRLQVPDWFPLLFYTPKNWRTPANDKFLYETLFWQKSCFFSLSNVHILPKFVYYNNSYSNFTVLSYFDFRSIVHISQLIFVVWVTFYGGFYREAKLGVFFEMSVATEQIRSRRRTPVPSLLTGSVCPSVCFEE